MHRPHLTLVSPLHIFAAYGWQLNLKKCEESTDMLFSKEGMIEVAPTLLPRAICELRLSEWRTDIDWLAHFHFATDADDHREKAKQLAFSVFHHILLLWGFDLAVRKRFLLPQPSLLFDVRRAMRDVANERCTTPLLFHGHGKSALLLQQNYTLLPHVLSSLATKEAGA